MTDQHEHKSNSGIPVWLWAAVVAPAIYILSVGPVGFLVVNNSNPSIDAALRTIYYPLILLHEHTFLRTPLDAYCALWGH